LCRTIRSPTVQALAQDHRNDVLTNSVGTAFALAGNYWLW